MLYFFVYLFTTSFITANKLIIDKTGFPFNLSIVDFVAILYFCNLYYTIYLFIYTSSKKEKEIEKNRNTLFLILICSIVSMYPIPCPPLFFFFFPSSLPLFHWFEYFSISPYRALNENSSCLFSIMMMQKWKLCFLGIGRRVFWSHERKIPANIPPRPYPLVWFSRGAPPPPYVDPLTFVLTPKLWKVANYVSNYDFVYLKKILEDFEKSNFY